MSFVELPELGAKEPKTVVREALSCDVSGLLMELKPLLEWAALSNFLSSTYVIPKSMRTNASLCRSLIFRSRGSASSRWRTVDSNRAQEVASFLGGEHVDRHFAGAARDRSVALAALANDGPGGERLVAPARRSSPHPADVRGPRPRGRLMLGHLSDRSTGGFRWGGQSWWRKGARRPGTVSSAKASPSSVVTSRIA